MGRASEVRDRPLERTRQQRRARWRLLRARQAQMGFGNPYSVDMQPQLSFVSFTRVKSRVPAVPSCPGGTPVKQGKVSEEDPAETASEASVELLTGVLNSEDLELAWSGMLSFQQGHRWLGVMWRLLPAQPWKGVVHSLVASVLVLKLFSSCGLTM